jgi:hypothetical protein
VPVRAQRPPLTPEQRSLRARIAGLTTAATHDPKAMTAPARAGFDKRFERLVDAEFPGLAPAERERRIEAAKRT